MRNLHRSSKPLAVLASVIGFCAASYAQHYVVTNDDNDVANTATIYRATGSPTNPSLTQVRVVKTAATSPDTTPRQTPSPAHFPAPGATIAPPSAWRWYSGETICTPPSLSRTPSPPSRFHPVAS
jgi:hypothetical protein